MEFHGLDVTKALGPLVIPAIMAGISLISGLIANRQNKKTNEANMELAKYGYDQQKQQIALQNKYNAPASQMQRYQEAGLNTNLIYGSGGSAGNQSSIPQFQAPKMDYQFQGYQIPDMISQYQDYQTKQVKQSNIESQTELLNQKVRTESVNRMNMLLKGERGKFDLDLAKELRKYNVDIRGSEATSAGIKAKALAQELSLLGEFGRAEKISRLKSQTIQQARTVVGTQSEQEKLALMKQFGWTKGYQESASRETKLLSAEQQAIYDKLKTTLFREHQMTPTDNFFVRMLMHFMMDNGMTPEDLGTFPPR